MTMSVRDCDCYCVGYVYRVRRERAPVHFLDARPASRMRPDRDEHNSRQRRDRHR